MVKLKKRSTKDNKQQGGKETYVEIEVSLEERVHSSREEGGMFMGKRTAAIA